MPLQLPITPSVLVEQVIDPALDILPSMMGSAKSAVLLAAIMIQESGLRSRQQYGGPAHGLAQFELNGVRAVMENTATMAYAKSLCVRRGVPFSAQSIYNYLLVDDILAAGLARLMLWADTQPLPEIGDIDGAYAYYKRAWGVGKPSESRWETSYADAMKAVGVSA